LQQVRVECRAGIGAGRDLRALRRQHDHARRRWRPDGAAAPARGVRARELAAARLLPVAADVSLDQRRAGARKGCGRFVEGHRPDDSGRGACRREGCAMIVCRSASELRRLRDANQLVGRVLQQMRQMVAPGVSTADLDALAEREIRAAGAVPAFKGYKGYPASICASINEQVVHGIPSPARRLRDGDIISIDLGAKLDGFFGDSAITVGVGKISPKAAELLRVTEESLWKAIEAVR